MTAKDFITILLSSYKYTKNIKIESLPRQGGTYYEVTAENPETEDCLYCDGESFQMVLFDILQYFERYDIRVSTFALDFSLKTLLDKEAREICHENIIKRQKEIENYIEKTKWISDLSQKTNPCIDCKLNKKDSNDDVHYNCDKNHRNICEYMIKHRDLISYLYSEYKIITQEKIEKITNELEENKNHTR